MKLNELIKHLRKEKGYTMRDLQHLSGVDASHLHKVEAGRGCTFDTANTLLLSLDFDLLRNDLRLLNEERKELLEIESKLWSYDMSEEDRDKWVEVKLKLSEVEQLIFEKI